MSTIANVLPKSGRPLLAAFTIFAACVLPGVAGRAATDPGPVAGRATPPAAASDKTVWLEGRLLGPDGQPVTEGFVMVRNDPYLNVLTDGEGRFRIDAAGHSVPDVLLASWAGSELAEAPLGARTKKDLEIRLKAQDPAFTKIEVGAALSCLRNGVLHDYYAQHRPFTAAEQDCVQAYDAFLKERGEQMIAQILAGKELPAGDDRYVYLLHAQLGVRAGGAVDRYRDSLLARARIILRRGWVHDPLRPGDLQVLRRYRALSELRHGQGGQGASWGGDAGFSPWKGHLGNWAREVGDPLKADFLRLEPLFNAPGFSVYSSLTLTEFIRFEGLGHIFSQFAAETPTDRGFEPASTAQLKQRFWHDYEQFVTLDDIAASGKPTLYFWTQLEDRTYPRWAAPFVEYVRRAYKDQANAVISTTLSPNFTDMFVDEYTYYGPNPKADPARGLDCRQFEEDYTPLRMARQTRVHCLEYPYLSAPLLLELTGALSGLRLMQTHNHLMVMDNRGRACDKDWGLLEAMGGWWSESFFGSFSDSLEGDFARTETILRAVIAHGGRYVPDIGKKLKVPAYPKRQLTHQDVFIVRSVDEKTGIVRAGWFKPPNRFNDGGNTGQLPDSGAIGDFRFKVSPDTRIVLGYQIRTLQDLKPGLRFWADFLLSEPQDQPRTSLAARSKDYKLRVFDMARYADKEIDTLRILDYTRHLGDEQLDMHVYGHITAREGDVITVTLSRDELQGMYGPRFWQEDKAVASAATFPTAFPAALYRDTIRRWLDGTEEDRTYRFALDRAVRVFRNGDYEQVTPADLQVGDYAWVTYETWWESSGRCHDVIFPNRIFASTPVQAPAGQATERESPEAAAPRTPTPTRLALAIGYAARQPAVDGDLADWAGVTALPAPFMKREASMLSLLWCEDGLYGAAQVRDAAVKANAAQPWTADCLELWIEKDNAKSPHSLPRSVQMVFAPPASGKDSDGPVVLIPWGGVRDFPENIPCAWKKTPEGYNIEFFIPAKLLAPATLKIGTQIGLNACIDDDGKPIEQLTADKNQDNAAQNPSAWGTAEFRPATP